MNKEEESPEKGSSKSALFNEESIIQKVFENRIGPKLYSSPQKDSDKVEQTCTTGRGNSNSNGPLEEAKLIIGLSRGDKSCNSNIPIVSGQKDIMNRKTTTSGGDNGLRTSAARAERQKKRNATEFDSVISHLMQKRWR